MTHLLLSWGYVALFLAVAVAAMGIPTGSELVIAFAGALASGKVSGGSHHLNLAAVIAVASVAELLGSSFGYGVGRLGGRPLVERLGRFVLVTNRDLDRAEAFFERRGEPVVFFGRFVPLLRSFVGIAAGIAEMATVRFVAFTGLAAVIWCSTFAFLGYDLGSRWSKDLRDVSDVGYGVAALVVVVAVGAFLKRSREVKITREAMSTIVRELSSRGLGPAMLERSAKTNEEGLTNLMPNRAHARSPQGPRADRSSIAGQLPILGRIFPAPLAAKVPEIIWAFWVVKILTTAGGEATSDFLKTWGNIKGGGTEVGLFLIGLMLQFGTRRYRAFAYWFFAFAIAIFGTGVSDFLHLDVGIPYAGTTLLWAVILAATFWVWYRSEGTLSIHSITTQRREAFYWATVFATFALGTALGDFTASSLNLGYLASGILFAVVILIPAAAFRFGLNGIAAFWLSYIVTRPLGASFADYISKSQNISGINFGDGPTAAVFALAVLVLVTYLAVARPDIQEWSDTSAQSRHSTIPGARDLMGEPELDLE